MKLYKYYLLLLFSGLMVAGMGTAQAGGALDFLDRQCAVAEEDTDVAVKQNKALLAALHEAHGKDSASGPTDAYRKAWWDLKLPMIRKVVIQQNIDAISKGEFDTDKGVEKFLSDHKGDIEKTIRMHYQQGIDTDLADASQVLNDDNQQMKGDLDENCPNDVGNQTIRATVNVITAPVNIIKGNLEDAKRESGELDKVIRGTIGISVKDIKKNGIFGGKNSIFRKPFG